MCSLHCVQAKPFIRCKPVLWSQQVAKKCIHLTIRAGVLRILIPASIGDQVACKIVEGYPAIHSFFDARNHLCPRGLKPAAAPVSLQPHQNFLLIRLINNIDLVSEKLSVVRATSLGVPAALAKNRKSARGEPR